MSDYIDRQAAIDALGMAIDVDDFRTATGLIHEATVSKVLDCIPAADVVPVVRCRNCRFFRHNYNYDRDICESAQGCVRPLPDGFCSYGERKE